MKFFKGIKNVFSLRRLEDTFSSTKSLTYQFSYIFVRALFYEYALGLVEREIYLQEEIAALEKQRTIDSLTQDREEALNNWQKELQSLNPIWWHLERDFYGFTTYEPIGHWVYDFYKNFGSAMASERAKRHCRMRGGCCARNCGCCSHARRTNRPRMKELNQYVGHCTRNCGCCTRYHRHSGVTDQDIDESRETTAASRLTHHPVYPFYREIRVLEKRTGEKWADSMMREDTQKEGACLPKPSGRNSLDLFLYQNYPVIFYARPSPSSK